jgi:O-acetyl-ADP-ribose deacetylase
MIELPARSYRNTFALALEHGVRSVAFPAISTGVYGYPKAEAARIAIGTMRAFDTQFERIVACCFDEADASLYRRVLAEGPAPEGVRA